MESYTERPRVIWQPVDPTNTHCLDVLRVDFDVKAERTSEGFSGKDLDKAVRGILPLWQRVEVEITAWPSPKRSRITFSNVIYFSFQEFEFEGGDPLDLVFQDHEVLFNVGALQNAGFKVPSGTALDSNGAFCLWTSDSSPLLSRLLDSGSLYEETASLKGMLRHYMLSCNELGRFHVVGASVDVAVNAI